MGTLKYVMKLILFFILLSFLLYFFINITKEIIIEMVNKLSIVITDNQKEKISNFVNNIYIFVALSYIFMYYYYEENHFVNNDIFAFKKEKRNAFLYLLVLMLILSIYLHFNKIYISFVIILYIFDRFYSAVAKQIYLLRNDNYIKYKSMKNGVNYYSTIQQFEKNDPIKIEEQKHILLEIIIYPILLCILYYCMKNIISIELIIVIELLLTLVAILLLQMYCKNNSEYISAKLLFILFIIIGFLLFVGKLWIYVIIIFIATYILYKTNKEKNNAKIIEEI